MEIGNVAAAVPAWVTWPNAAIVIQGVLTLVIAGIAVAIQRQQAVTNTIQLRLALFERRMKVFDATLDLIALVMRQARIDLSELVNFLIATREHSHLFGQEITDYITLLHQKGLDLWTLREGVSEPEDIRRRTELLTWFAKQTEVTHDKFLKYIDFRTP